MTITLPPRQEAALEIEMYPGRQIIIIGANGAGKTRFAQKMKQDFGPQSYTISAIRAIFGNGNPDLAEGSIDQRYAAIVNSGTLIRQDLSTQWERMMALLLHEEMRTLMGAKWVGKSASAETKLDRLIKLWEEVFPHNRVLIESGNMVFSRQGNMESYIPELLSTGEKAVLYYIGAALLAPENSYVFVDAPEMFLHPSSTRTLWDSIETERPDCTFIYITHDLSFPSTRTSGTTIWVKGYDPDHRQWDYDFLPDQEGISEELYLTLLGARKPVLFIEGDSKNSYDSKFYPLIFKEYTVKPLGGCDRVIEATRSFNGLKGFHSLDAFGIVDRDRRSDSEVAYLREKKIFVPDVAEIENIFMLEDVIRTVASRNGKDENIAFQKVRKAILRLFETDLKPQALQHTRHRIKRSAEHQIDGKFNNINAFEQHVSSLPIELNARGLYESLCREFRGYVARGSYEEVLRVYNRKTMLTESHVADSCGIRSGDRKAYTRQVIGILKKGGPDAERITRAVKNCFNIR